MENNKKKPIFEPVSAEEAKKIRASGGKDGSWDSGVLCESGIHDEWQACWLKMDGTPCCYLQNGQEKRGVCVETGGSPPDSFLTVRCKVDPF